MSVAYPLSATTPSSEPVLAVSRPAAGVPAKRVGQRAAACGDRQRLAECLSAVLPVEQRGERTTRGAVRPIETGAV